VEIVEPGERLGPTVPRVHLAIKEEPRDGVVEERHAPSLGIDEGEMQIGPGGRDDEPGDPASGPEIQDPSVDPHQCIDESLGVGHVIFDRSRTEGAELAGFFEHLEEVGT